MRYVETREVGVNDLAAFPGNARVHAAAVLEESARTNGQYRSIVARRHADGRLEILAGHGTRQAFADIGAAKVRVEVIECDDAEAARIVLIDNRGNDLASYDEELLAELLADVPDLLGTGYDQADLDALLAGLHEPAGQTDPDDAPPVPDVARSAVGDVWLLGPHRLVCGDATDRDVVAAVMAGGRADAMWTDPPYGVEYVGKTKDKLTIEGDGAAGLPELLAGAFGAATAALVAGAGVYVAHADTARTVFEAAFTGAGWTFRQNLIWVKDSMVLGRSDYHYRHEPILYGFTASKAKGRRGRGGDTWFGDNAATSVFEVPRPKASKLHPTMKPVELIVRCLNNSCRPGGLVYDPFGGSGSTLIAAHLTGRTARLVELDPAYADVIARRWQEHTGVVPILEATGEAVDFLAPA